VLIPCLVIIIIGIWAVRTRPCATMIGAAYAIWNVTRKNIVSVCASIAEAAYGIWNLGKRDIICLCSDDRQLGSRGDRQYPGS
jgi:hypothetical protein